MQHMAIWWVATTCFVTPWPSPSTLSGARGAEILPRIRVHVLHHKPTPSIPAYVSKTNSREEAKKRKTRKGQREREDVLEESAYQPRPQYRDHVQ